MHNNLFSFIFHFVKKYKYRLMIAQLLFLGWSLNATIWPYAHKLFFDKIILFDQSADISIWSFMMPILIFFIFIWIGIELMFRAGGFVIAYYVPNMLADIRMYLFSYVQHHSYNYFADNFAGNIANKVNDMVSGIERIIQFMTILLIPVVTTLIIIEAMFITIQPLFGLVFLVWFFLHISTAIYGGRYCSNISKEHAESRSKVMGRMVDIFTNIVNVKLFAQEHSEYINIKHHQNIEQQNNKNAFLSVEYIRIIFGILSFIFPGVLVHVLMLKGYQNGSLTIGDLVLIFDINLMLSMMVWQLGSELPMIFKDIGVCNQALTLIKAQHDIVDNKHAKDIKITSGTIEFKNITFGYNKSKNVFHNLNIVINNGQKVGLVGFSGSGKSTFVNLLMRFFDTGSGDIYIDSHNIKDIKISSIRNAISMIPQDPSLFHRTILENIKYGNENASMSDVYQAADHAVCDFIDYLPDKFDTLVGERGVKLSGGQRQRIAIARAILKDSPLLILDEATSALDSVTEKKIQLAIKYLIKDKTTIVVAHRLSTLVSMDRILVFDDGDIIEDGSFNELINKKGHFYKMWQMQADGFLP